MNSNFDIASLAIKALAPNNELLYDDKGMPSVMVKVPKMTYAQLGLGASTATYPAFIVNGQEVNEVYISKYHNVVNNGRAYSLPGEDPHTLVTLDEAIGYCTAKGEGWHLMTRMEWAMIAQWCLNNGFLPYGNNDYGKDSREKNYKAIPTYTYDDNGTQRIGRVATGTGPLEWSHDKTISGIWDLNGNVWDWVGGVRLVKGELQVLANNNAADLDNPQTEESTMWMCINGSGNYIAPNGLGTTVGALRLDYVSSAWKWITGTPTSQVDSHRYCLFESVTYDSATVGANALLILQTLGFYKYNTTAGAYEGDYFYANNGADERSFLAGGSWHYGAHYGVFASYANNPRSDSCENVGFRAAYVKLPPA